MHFGVQLKMPSAKTTTTARVMVMKRVTFSVTRPYARA